MFDLQDTEGVDIRQLLQREAVVRGREMKLDKRFEEAKAKEVAAEFVKGAFETNMWRSSGAVLAGCLHQELQKMFNNILSGVTAALKEANVGPHEYGSGDDVNGEREAPSAASSSTFNELQDGVYAVIELKEKDKTVTHD
jgi:hypothetical protein